MGGVFPSAPDVATYWQNILECKDSRVEVTAERWVDDPDWFVDREDADRVSNLKVCLAESIPEPRAGLDEPMDQLSRMCLAADLSKPEAQTAKLASRSLTQA